MAKVRRVDTQPELRLRTELRRSALRGRRLGYGSDLPGSPDIVLRRLHVAIFVDGCFWHGCPRHGSLPKTNTSFWRAKLERNQARDKNVDRALKELGWKTLRFWEHEIHEDLAHVIAKIKRAVKLQEARFKQNISR